MQLRRPGELCNTLEQRTACQRRGLRLAGSGDRSEAQRGLEYRLIDVPVSSQRVRLCRMPLHIERPQLRGCFCHCAARCLGVTLASQKFGQHGLGSMRFRVVIHARPPRFRPLSAAGEIVVPRSQPRHRAARCGLTQPLTFAYATKHMCSRIARAPAMSPTSGAGFDQPTMEKRGVELATPRFNPLDCIAQLLQPCGVSSARPARKSSRRAINHQQQQGCVFSATRAPSTATRSASSQRPCQTNATATQLRTELATGWVELAEQVIAP